MDGQGSDEYFAGYMGFFPTHYAHLAKHLRLARLLSEVRNRKSLHGVSLSKSAKETLIHSVPSWLRSTLKSISGKNTLPLWLNTEAFSELDRPQLINHSKQHYYSSIFELSKK